ncbi:MAG: DinB family protein [Bacteroidota bacterium]
MPSSVSTRLQYQHKSLIDLIEGLSDEQIRMHINPGKWSIFENIVHLQAYQHTMIKRIRQILDEDSPSFGAYIADADPLFLDNCAKSSREVIQDLLTVRKDMSAGILSFTETDLERTGLHPKFGKCTWCSGSIFFSFMNLIIFSPSSN